MLSRAFHTATRVGNGQAPITGGATVRSWAQAMTAHTSITPLASAERFNPFTVSFTKTSNMTTASLLAYGDIAKEWKHTRGWWGRPHQGS